MLREGRLGKGMDKDFAQYTSSLDFDRRIFKWDIIGDMAHAIMLSRQGILDKGDAGKILEGLKKILGDGIENLELDSGQEDIHMVIEGALIERIGDIGGKLHTARSRNDQVATDLRLWVRDETITIIELMASLENMLLSISEKNLETYMPGYTHLQRAQPVTLSHHMNAYFEVFARDIARFEDSLERVNINPLGSGALAATSFDIDREMTAKLLGFQGAMANSMDGVGSRDFILELMGCLAILATTMTRLAEEIIIWSTREFNFIELSDSFSSTSSIMPQKKNPDGMEVMRGKLSRVMGNHTSALTLMKSLPYTYNRDLQELSPLAGDSIDIIKSSLILMEKTLAASEFKMEEAESALEGDFLVATELADLIVKQKGLPFRTAHQIVGALVSRSMQDGLSPKDIDGDYLDNVSKAVMGKKLGLKDVGQAFDFKRAVTAKGVFGGPSPERSRSFLKDARLRLEKIQNANASRMNDQNKIERTIFEEMENL